MRVKGPCPMEEGHFFVIDGRDEQWPEALRFKVAVGHGS